MLSWWWVFSGILQERNSFERFRRLLSLKPTEEATVATFLAYFLFYERNWCVYYWVSIILYLYSIILRSKNSTVKFICIFCINQNKNNLRVNKQQFSLLRQTLMTVINNMLYFKNQNLVQNFLCWIIKLLCNE